MRSHLFPIIALLALSASGGAEAKKPQSLDDFIKSLGFEPFHPPRTADGLGAVISFDRKGRESIESQPGGCLDPVSAGALPNNDPVAVAALDYKVTTGNKFGATVAGDAVAKAIGVSEFDASAAIGTDRVSAISVKLTKPYRNRLVRANAMTQVRTKAKDLTCAAVLASKKNLIIQSILGAQSISYTFTDNGGRQINLTLKLLKALGLSADMQKKYEGKGSLDIAGNVLLGYNAWQASTLAGLETSASSLIEVSPKNIERLRADAMK